MFFDNLDIVISFGIIMLLLSLLVTTLVQMMVSLLGLRGRNLFWAVGQILQQLAPVRTDTSDQDARNVAGEILAHPALTSEGPRVLSWIRGKGAYGPTSISTKDFLLILQKLNANGSERVKEEIRRLLPVATDESVEASSLVTELGLKLQGLLPDQAPVIESIMKETLEEGQGFVTEVENWFDTVMTSASSRFKLWSRWWTVGIAVSLAIVVQIDSIDIVRQLSNEAIRSNVLARSERVMDWAEQALDKDLSKAEREASKDKNKSEESATEQGNGISAGSIREVLESTGLTLIHSPGEDGYLSSLPDRLPGILISAALLSLGAPFWYGLLGKLVGFKSSFSRQSESETPAKDS